MTRKPFIWRKLTPAQIDLMERIAKADGALPYKAMDYRDLLALGELQKLGLADTRAKRRRLEAHLTDAGRQLRADHYITDKVVLRITGPQLDLLRYLINSPIDESVGQPMNAMPGTMYDVCRRMFLRGWVEWYDGWNGLRWARLTLAGREVVKAVDSTSQNVIQFDDARRRKGLI